MMEQDARDYYDWLCADLKGGKIVDVSWGPFSEGEWGDPSPGITLTIEFPTPRILKHLRHENDAFFVKRAKVGVWQDEEGNGPGELIVLETEGYEEVKNE